MRFGPREKAAGDIKFFICSKNVKNHPIGQTRCTYRNEQGDQITSVSERVRIGFPTLLSYTPQMKTLTVRLPDSLVTEIEEESAHATFQNLMLCVNDFTSPPSQKVQPAEAGKGLKLEFLTK